MCIWSAAAVLTVRHSQLQDENHVRAVLVGVVQRHDVGVPDLPQDVHLSLDLLPPHSPRTGRALALLDELCGELAARALLPTLLYDGELSAEAEAKRRRPEGGVKGGIGKKQRPKLVAILRNLHLAHSWSTEDV